MLGYVSHYTTARDIWCALEDLFHSTSLARVMQLCNQLQHLKKGKLSVEEYFLQMRNLANQLSAAGQKVSDEELLCYILNGFGLEFDAVVVNISNQTDMNIQQIQFALQAHEVRLQTHSSYSSHSAHYASNCPRSQSLNRGGQSSNNSAQKGRSQNRFGQQSCSVLCQLCGKIGHTALKCFKRFDVLFTGPVPNSSNETSHAYLATYSNDPSIENPMQIIPTGAWIVELPPTSPMTSVIRLSILLIKANDNVVVGNGQQLQIDATGQSHIEEAAERAAGKRTLPN